MKHDIAEKWVAALRSGEYTQAQHVLKHADTGAMCCLGVLCDLYAKEHDDGKWGETSDEYIEFVVSRAGEELHKQMSVLPKPVREWAGIRTDNGTTSDDICLSHENDKGRSFASIAEIIEEHKGML